MNWRKLITTSLIGLGLWGCDEGGAQSTAPAPSGVKKAKPKAQPIDPATAAELAKKGENPADLDPMIATDPKIRKLAFAGKEFLTTRKKFYQALKALVMNPKMPPAVLKEEIHDLYDVYEMLFLDHGHKIQGLGGDMRGTILKIDNYITAEPMGITIWIEKESERLKAIEPSISELLVKAYAIPRVYDFDAVRKNDPIRARKLGIMPAE